MAIVKGRGSNYEHLHGQNPRQRPARLYSRPAQPAFQAIAIQSAPIERAGVSTATYFLALDISVGAGSVILAVLASAWGYQYLYMFTALVMVIALALYHIWVKRYTPLEL